MARMVEELLIARDGHEDHEVGLEESRGGLVVLFAHEFHECDFRWVKGPGRGPW